MEFTKDRPLRVFTAFSGYDSQCLALDRLKQMYPEFDYDLVGWSEIDKYAIASHDAIYPQWADRNYGDVSKIDWTTVPPVDLFTYSFPCTDISNAGEQKGLAEGSGTRSSLLWECIKAIEVLKPKYLLMENVKALTGKKFIGYLEEFKHQLERDYHYNSWYSVLNATSFGIPQNRERVFMVSILDEYANFKFPAGWELDKCLADVLEKDVDEDFFISEKRTYDLMQGVDADKLLGIGYKMVKDET